MSQNAFYTYSTVSALLEKIDSLNAILGRSQPLKPVVSTESTLVSHSSEAENLTLSIDELSNEVGTLTTSSNEDLQGKYIGAATGTKFAKMFLRQMHLQKLDDLEHLSTSDFSLDDTNVGMLSRSCAPLPPFGIAKMAVNNYINYIEVYYPILLVKDLLSSLDRMYRSPKDLTYHEKYIVFMTIAIGLDKGEKDPRLINYYNQFKPVEFFNTAQKYLEKLLPVRSLSTLQELILLAIWLISTNVFKDDNGDLWHLGRYMMSLALELNLQKLRPNKNVLESKQELRNRLFWSTYLLERANAVKFGRGLSFRKQDIQIAYPRFLIDDDLTGDNSLNDYNMAKFQPCLIMIEVSEIYGVLLETIYISRTKGSKPILSDETMLDYKFRIQESVSRVLTKIDSEIPKDLFCYHELKIRTHIASILLHRPSPSYLSPDLDSLLTCKEDCSSCMESFKVLMNSTWKISPPCLHDLVNVSLTMIYCCWKTESTSERLKSFSTDTLGVMNEIIKLYPSFTKFKNLYIVVSSIIINGFENTEKKDSQVDQFAGDVFSDVPSPLQKLKANMMQSINHNYANPFQPQYRADNKRRYTETEPNVPTFSPLTSSQIQHQLQHVPIKFKDSQNFQQGSVEFQQHQQRQQHQHEFQQFSGSNTHPIQSKDDKVYQQQRYAYQYNMPANGSQENPAVMDTLTQELFQDVFKQYYFQGNDTVREDIDQLFEFQRFNWT